MTTGYKKVVRTSCGFRESETLVSALVFPQRSHKCFVFFIHSWHVTAIPALVLSSIRHIYTHFIRSAHLELTQQACNKSSLHEGQNVAESVLSQFV